MRSLGIFAVLLLTSIIAASQNAGKIIVVRHAEKQSDASDTPLSNKGLMRANCLAQTLKDAHITTAIVSQYQRTKQTAAPTVAEFKAKEAQFDAKAKGPIVRAARDAAKSGNVLIVGHSNTIPDLLAAFGTSAVIIPDTTYDQLFIFNAEQPQDLTTLHYCPSLATDKLVHPAGSMAK